MGLLGTGRGAHGKVQWIPFIGEERSQLGRAAAVEPRSRGVQPTILHECIKGVKGGRGPSEPHSVKGLSPEVQRPAGVDIEEERPGLT